MIYQEKKKIKLICKSCGKSNFKKMVNGLKCSFCGSISTFDANQIVLQFNKNHSI